MNKIQAGGWLMAGALNGPESKETSRKVAMIQRKAEPLGDRATLRDSSSLRAVRGRRRGFTLLEMLIVIFIILALGGIVLFNLIGTQEKAETDIVRVQIDTFRNALETFRVEMGRWPTEDEGLAALWDKSAIQDEVEAAKWRKYLNEPAPRDKWGSAWVYRQPSQLADGEPYDIVSPGPDKQEGTADDITNHDRRRGADGEISSEAGGGRSGGG
jgi:general secretion pathway protein G